MKIHQILFVLLLFVALGSPPVFSQELLTNRTFDTGIEGWTTRGVGPGTIVWDSAQGQPPGSLRFPDEDQVAITQACFHPQVGTYTLSTDAYLETSGQFVECLINFVLYLEPDCSGEGSPIIDVNGGGVIFPRVTAPNTWQHLEFEFHIGQDTLDQSGILGIRPLLTKLGDFPPLDACLYDNVSLSYTPPSVTEVPALGSAGLTVLAALLGVSGALTLRRRLSG